MILQPNDTTKNHRGFAFVTLDSHERQQTSTCTGYSARRTQGNVHQKAHLVSTTHCSQSRGMNNKEFVFCGPTIVVLMATLASLPMSERDLVSTQDESTTVEEKKKRKKCFDYKKGKCKAGDACLFSHDFQVTPKEMPKRPNSEKDCLAWRKKGKCNKRETCPYRHDDKYSKKGVGTEKAQT